MPSRNLDDLDSRIRPIIDAVIEACKMRYVGVTVITTLRTAEEEAIEVKEGRSTTMNSKHLPQPPDGKSLAVDLAPTTVLDSPDWMPEHPDWWVIAEEGVKRGLRSGMDWKGVGLPPVGCVTHTQWDAGHLELDVLNNDQAAF